MVEEEEFVPDEGFPFVKFVAGGSPGLGHEFHEVVLGEFLVRIFGSLRGVEDKKVE